MVKNYYGKKVIVMVERYLLWWKGTCYYKKLLKNAKNIKKTKTQKLKFGQH